MSYVVGHKRVLELLKRLLTGSKFPHALLFVGREGIGKKRVAHVAASYFLCKKGGCLSCRDCKRVLEGLHPDFRLEAPKGKGGGILIEQIRELRDWAFMAPMEGERKVAVLDDAHLMRPEAANALLKTLEEPPEGTLFILVTSEQSKLLPTIVSRCQIVRFHPLSRQEVEEVCERIGVPEEVKRFCAEAGTLRFASVMPSQIETAKRAAETLLKNPSLKLLAMEEVWSQETTFSIFLFLVRKKLNGLLRKGWNERLWDLHRGLLEVERLFYGSNL